MLHGVGERFDFTHDRIREVAFGQLLSPRRQLLHGQVARALEERYARDLEPHAAALALHYRKAEVWDKALVFLRQAGLQAAARSAHREAVACFEQALGALGHLPEGRARVEQAVDLRFDLRNSLLPLGEFARTLDHLREAEALAEALEDRRRLGWVLAYITQQLRIKGEPDRAIDSGQRALALVTALDDLPLRVVVNFFLGMTYYAVGDYRRARDCLETNVAALEGDLLHERFGLPGVLSVMSGAFLVLALAELGEFSAGMARGEEGVRIAEAVDQPFSRVAAYAGVGLVCCRQGRLEKAIPTLERALGLCQGWNLPYWFPRVASVLGSAYALCGRGAEATPLLEQAVKQATSVGHLGRLSLSVAWLGEAYLLAGRKEEARECAERALALSRDHKERGHQAFALQLLGEIDSYHDAPDVERAGAHYCEALALAEELGMRPLQAHCQLGFGKLYLKVGRSEEARSELSTAIDMYRSMDMSFWLSQAEAVAGKLGGI